MNEVKRYMNAIERRLRMDGKTRQRIMRDLASDFHNRRDAGQTDAEIMAELGSPDQVAAEFNAAFGGGAWTPSPWRWLFLAGAILTGVVLLLTLWLLPLFNAVGDMGIIGGADGPTAIIVTSRSGSADPDTVIMTGGTLILTLLAGFLLLGWCRGGGKRAWLPVILCALPLVGAILWAAIILAEALWAGLSLAVVMQILASLFGGAVCLALIADAAVLVWSIRNLKQ